MRVGDRLISLSFAAVTRYSFHSSSCDGVGAFRRVSTAGEPQFLLNSNLTSYKFVATSSLWLYSIGVYLILISSVVAKGIS